MDFNKYYKDFSEALKIKNEVTILEELEGRLQNMRRRKN